MNGSFGEPRRSIVTRGEGQVRAGRTHFQQMDERQKCPQHGHRLPDPRRRHHEWPLSKLRCSVTFGLGSAISLLQERGLRF
jgi:hypothetical protein